MKIMVFENGDIYSASSGVEVLGDRYRVGHFDFPFNGFVGQVLDVELPEDFSHGEYAYINGQFVRKVRPVPPSKSPEEIQKEVTEGTQLRLDTFARTRNYDGILSACTYATSSIPKFQAEGQYCVNARDNTWAALYSILAEVQEGTRPIPSSYADIEGDLPILIWPE